MKNVGLSREPLKAFPSFRGSMNTFKSDEWTGPSPKGENSFKDPYGEYYKTPHEDGHITLNGDRGGHLTPAGVDYTPKADKNKTLQSDSEVQSTPNGHRCRKHGSQCKELMSLLAKGGDVKRLSTLKSDKRARAEV